jgi:DivIVA domain-containing protein
MADEVTSGEIRTRRFDVIRKGYDRHQVDLFLAQVARQFDSLEKRIAEAAAGEASLGIDDPEAHARELATIGSEIEVILEAARVAAEAMRSRASSDAESWTTEAKAYNEESTSEADSQAHAARGAAWEEGSAMLTSAVEEAGMARSEAETDALRIRAEAEREAIRHTSDAKRASEEVIGAAENEAEAILASSRVESERVLRAANQSAELAQERARALEDRRAELLAELESTRTSIGDLESQIESKRQALEEPEPVIVPGYEERTHHDTGGGTVRIVSGSKIVPLRPVDADSFVAEVAELHRKGERSQDEEGSQFTSHSSQSERQSSSPSQPVGGYVVDRDGWGEPDDSSQAAASPKPEEPVHLKDSSQAEQSRPPEDPPQLDEESPKPEVRSPKSEPGPQPREEPIRAEDPIGSLFAQLREDTTAKQPSMKDESQSTVGSSQSEGEPRSTVDRPQSEYGEQRTANGTDSETDDDEGVVSLIPVQNAALRTIKRQLVDLQNDALEHHRTDKTWVPGEEFTDRFSEPFSELAEAITDDGDDGGAAYVFATDLYDAVSSAVTAARQAGSGDRAIAAATSKVFRTWRSDEAERRVLGAASDLSDRE